MMKQPVKYTEEFWKWHKKLLREKRHYNLFKNVELDTDMLAEYFVAGKTPIETLNDLSTVS